MKATLIEIDPLCPPGYPYAHLAGRRLWAVACAESQEGDCWAILPGQGIPEPLVILAEHAWMVNEMNLGARAGCDPAPGDQPMANRSQ